VRSSDGKAGGRAVGIGSICEDCSCHGMCRFDQTYRLVLRVNEDGMNIMSTADGCCVHHREDKIAC
jgi:hypothetical protein